MSYSMSFNAEGKKYYTNSSTDSNVSPNAENYN